MTIHLIIDELADEKSINEILEKEERKEWKPIMK